MMPPIVSRFLCQDTIAEAGNVSIYPYESELKEFCAMRRLIHQDPDVVSSGGRGEHRSCSPDFGATK